MTRLALAPFRIARVSIHSGAASLEILSLAQGEPWEGGALSHFDAATHRGHNHSFTALGRVARVRETPVGRRRGASLRATSC